MITTPKMYVVSGIIDFIRQRLLFCTFCANYKLTIMTNFEGFEWVSSQLVQKLIENSENSEKIRLTSFQLENALLGGANFSSSIIRLKVRFDNCKCETSRVFLIKMAINSKEFSDICEECRLFEKEIEVYTKILPEVKFLLESIGEIGTLAPKCFMSDISQRMLIFEDLSVEGFENADKTIGFNINYMKLILSSMAKWHAATSILLLKKPELFTEHLKKNWYKNDTNLRIFFRNIAKTVSNAARKWEDFEKIADKLINVPDHIYENIYKSYLAKEDKFNTLIHGDMWSNNIMFQHHQNGMPTEVRFIDFALGKYTSPSIDLDCLLYGCSHDQLSQGDREDLIQFYHIQLVDLLKRLNFPGKIPSLLEIQLTSFHVDLYNALIILLLIGIRYVTKSGEFMNLVNGNEFSEMYSGPECIAKLKYMLKLFDRRGLFDF